MQQLNCTEINHLVSDLFDLSLSLYCVTKLESLLLFCQKTVVNPAPAAHCHLQVFNLAKGNVSVSIQGSDLFPEPIPYLQVALFSLSFLHENTASHALVVLVFVFSLMNVSSSLSGPSQIRGASARRVQQEPARGSHV